MQSYFIGVEGNPASNMRAEVNFNVVGNVAQNPINEIFYENNSRPIEVNTDQGNVVVQDVNRVRVYQAEFEWNAKEFDLKDFTEQVIFIGDMRGISLGFTQRRTTDPT